VSHSFTVGRNNVRTIDDRTAHAEWGRIAAWQNDKLRLSLRDRVGDANLVKARIGPRAGIDLAQSLTRAIGLRLRGAANRRLVSPASALRPSNVRVQTTVRLT
jgi:hypothetical protein